MFIKYVFLLGLVLLIAVSSFAPKGHRVAFPMTTRLTSSPIEFLSEVLSRAFATKAVSQLWDDIGPKFKTQFILTSCAPWLPPESVVKRQELEQRILQHINTPIINRYMCVVGKRGSGKTTVIQQICIERKNVVYVDLSKDLPTINTFLNDRLGTRNQILTNKQIFNRPFKAKPVLIVEIDSNMSADTVKEQSQEVKQLCDAKLVHGIIVLSDANAVFKLNDDPARQAFLWVGDFTRDETNAYLDKYGVLLTDGEAADGPNSKLRLRLMDEVGSNAAWLRFLAADAVASKLEAVAALPDDASFSYKTEVQHEVERGLIENFIEKQLYQAIVDVKKVQDKVPETTQIMSSLLDSSTGKMTADKVQSTGFDVMMKIKQNNLRVITYNHEERAFEFYSKAYELAARRLVQKGITNSAPWLLLFRFGTVCMLPLYPLLFCLPFDVLLLASCSLNRTTPSPPPFVHTTLDHFCKNPLPPRAQRSPPLFSSTIHYPTLLTPPSTHNSFNSTICTHRLVDSPQKRKRPLFYHPHL
jgi:hypothetical protein